MSNLKLDIVLQTAFGEYTLKERIGEGGAGRVFGGIADDGSRIAVKVLTQTSTDKRRRFKNEIGFLANNKHPNIVTVIDHGIANVETLKGPFYVMRRYDCSLREHIGKMTPDRSLKLFAQMLDGVEAAHMQGVVHRDLKPENFLFDGATDSVAVADFGIANFTADQLLTLVETSPMQRLANFMYAAPEQRTPGHRATAMADIYALGLMLNELFTGNVPHGTNYQIIGTVASMYGFLDPIIAQMIRQNPDDRPEAIGRVKILIQHYHAEAVAMQKISKINGTVIKADEVDEPLAIEPPTLVRIDVENGHLHLIMDRRVNQAWIQALYRSPVQYRMGAPPKNFVFQDNVARVRADEQNAQAIIDYFKAWLPVASRTLKEELVEKALKEEAAKREVLRLDREAEERRLRLIQNLRI